MNVTTIESYIQLAGQTDSPDYKAPLARQIQDRNINMLKFGLRLGVLHGEYMDHLKRKTYYGKEITDVITDNTLTAIDNHLENCDFETDDAANSGAIKLISDHPEYCRLLHAVIGLSTEVGELQSQLYSTLFKGEPLDWINVKEELGDVLWYAAILFDMLEVITGAAPIAVLQTNIDKLRARYPNKFTEMDAIHRNLEQERAILEKGHNV